MSDRTLLCLCMILKDEVHTIRRTLESVAGVVDRFSIYDTGSTDGTQDLIRQVAVELKVPCEVHQGEFINFASARNRALDACGYSSDYILSLDADDTLVGGKRLRDFLMSVRGHAKDEAYYLMLRTSQTFAFTTCRLFRARARWRYVGVVHELLLPPRSDSYPGGLRHIDGVEVLHEKGAEGHEKTKTRWSRDVVALTEELKRDPTNTRAAFYLGCTLKDLGTLEGATVELHLQAFRAFDKRIKMGGGFADEIFCSKLECARSARKAGLPWAQCVSLWHAAIEQDGRRIEPYADLLVEHGKRDEHHLCVLYAERAFNMSEPPKGTLFVEDWRYTTAHYLGWHAWYTGPTDHEIGKAGCLLAMSLRPGVEQDRNNYENYLKREREKGWKPVRLERVQAPAAAPTASEEATAHQEALLRSLLASS